MDNEDIIKFAESIGLYGIDADLFYELYYKLDNDEVERYYEEEYEVR